MNHNIGFNPFAGPNHQQRFSPVINNNSEVFDPRKTLMQLMHMFPGRFDIANNINKVIQAVDSRVAELEQMHSSAQTDYEEKSEEVVHLTDTIRELRAKINVIETDNKTLKEASNTHTQQVSDLKSKYETELERIKESARELWEICEQEKKSLQTRLNLTVQEHSNHITELNDQHQAELRALKEQHALELARIKIDHTSLLETLSSEYETRISEILCYEINEEE